MANESEQIGQNEIEELLRAANKGAPAAPVAKPAAADDVGLGQAEIEALLGVGTATRTAGANLSEIISSNDIELLLKKAEDAIASIDHPADNLPPGITPFSLPTFSGAAANSEAATLELVRDVQLDLKIELGRTHMQLEDVLRLRRGAVVALDKLAGDPVDVFVNGRLIARGEVLVLNDNFCVRVTELVVGEAAAA
jgi:flagellar motor switch protein FliN/FliY